MILASLPRILKIRMATLTETAYVTRKIIYYFVLAVISYIVIRLLWGFIAFFWTMIFPPKPPLPNQAFGKLTQLVFPQKDEQGIKFTYTLETIEGTLPEASSSATVYFMPKKAANLLALTKTQAFAERLGFATEPVQENKNIYRFNDPNYPLRTLRYDIVSDNFILRYAFEQDPSLLFEKDLPITQTALAEGRGLLQSYGLYNENLEKGNSRVSFLKLSGNRLIETTSLSQADSVRIDFFHRNIGNTKVVTPIPNEGLAVIIFSGTRLFQRRILQLAYTYWPIDYETTATYPLKASSVAWQELTNGKCYIAQYPTKGTQVVVRNVYLAYYYSFDPQMYLQPVFVIEGDNGFIAYVPAVSPEWVESN